MKKAIVLGGTHDHIRLIEILKKRGYQTCLIDYLNNPPARAFCDQYYQESTLDINAVTSIAKKLNPDLVISACIDQALLTMAHVSENLNLPCHINYQTALEITNKAYMKIKLMEHNIPTPKFEIQKDFDPDSIKQLRYPIVVKPVDSNSSKGITKVKSRHELADAARLAILESRTNMIIFEEYIEGEEFSVDVIVRDGIPNILLVTKNIKLTLNESTFTIVQSYFPATTDPKILQNIQYILHQIVTAFNIQNSPLLLQLIHRNGEIYVIEFSARIAGGSKHYFIQELRGFDILNYYVNLLSKISDEVSINNTNSFALIQYLYMNPGKYKGIRGVDELLKSATIKSYFTYKQQACEISDNSSSSDRIGGYLLRTDSEDNLKMLNKQINEYLKRMNFGIIDILT